MLFRRFQNEFLMTIGEVQLFIELEKHIVILSFELHFPACALNLTQKRLQQMDEEQQMSSSVKMYIFMFLEKQFLNESLPDILLLSVCV